MNGLGTVFVFLCLLLSGCDLIKMKGTHADGEAGRTPVARANDFYLYKDELAGITAPLAYLIAGIGMLLVAVSVSQLAKAFPSAGGWYTWIARSLHPRAGFLAGWIFSIWLPPVGVLTYSFFSKTVLEPALTEVNAHARFHAEMEVLDDSLTGKPGRVRFTVLSERKQLA